MLILRDSCFTLGVNRQKRCIIVMFSMTYYLQLKAALKNVLFGQIHRYWKDHQLRQMLFADVCNYDIFQQRLTERYCKQQNLDPLKQTFCQPFDLLFCFVFGVKGASRCRTALKTPLSSLSMVRCFHSKVDPFDIVLVCPHGHSDLWSTQRFARRERRNMWCQCATMVGGYKAHLGGRMWVFLRAASRTSQSRHTADLRSSNVMEQKHGNCAINSEFLISWEIMIQCVGRRLLRDHQRITHTHTHTHTHTAAVSMA